jgi:thymidylate synthase (FAD)
MSAIDMRIYTEPKVHLVARSSTVLFGVSSFLENNQIYDWETDATSCGEELIEFAGRVCYMSFNNPRPGGNEKYLEHILEAGHGSVLEHAVYTFAIEGVSRSLTHELIRHRAGFGFSQLSQRYCDKIGFVLPPIIPVESDMATRWAGQMGIAYDNYNEHVAELETMLDHIESKTLRRKRAREAARSVLPNATETKIVVTGNARAWRHFIELRGSADADLEIQRLAGSVLEVLRFVSPVLFDDYCSDNGVITGKYRKV